MVSDVLVQHPPSEQGQECVQLEGLGQLPDDERRLLAQLAAPRHEHHLDVPGRLQTAQPVQELCPIHPRHQVVEKHECRGLAALECRKCRHAIRRDNVGMTFEREQVRDFLAHVFVVVHDEDRLVPAHVRLDSSKGMAGQLARRKSESRALQCRLDELAFTGIRDGGVRPSRHPHLVASGSSTTPGGRNAPRILKICSTLIEIWLTTQFDLPRNVA